MALDDPSRRHPLVLDDGKVLVVFAILLSRGRAQKHNGV
jgi:hypothetical protein